MEGGLRLIGVIVVLSEMRADEGDQLQLDVHMSGPESTDEGGSGSGMRQLWVQRMCLERLRSCCRPGVSGWESLYPEFSRPSITVDGESGVLAY
jgi:hypothetical protein